jgi:hypothetical protein
VVASAALSPPRGALAQAPTRRLRLLQVEGKKGFPSLVAKVRTSSGAPACCLQLAPQLPCPGRLARVPHPAARRAKPP